jgi:DNA-binding PadR family transcriptional regulator
MQPSDLLKGNLQTIILKLLADHGKMYGYEITQKVKELSSGSMVLTEGALYPTLHKLEADGMVKTETASIGKRIRKYYTLTHTGRVSVASKIEEYIGFVRIMTQVLKLDINPGL